MDSPPIYYTEQWYTFDGDFEFIFDIIKINDTANPNVQVRVISTHSCIVENSPPDNPFQLVDDSKVNFSFVTEDKNEICGELNVVEFKDDVNSCNYGIWGHIKFGNMLRKAFEGIMVVFNY